MEKLNLSNLEPEHHNYFTGTPQLGSLCAVTKDPVCCN